MPQYPGVSAPYEAPAKPDLILDTEKMSIAECVEKVVELLQQKKSIR